MAAGRVKMTPEEKEESRVFFSDETYSIPPQLKSMDLVVIEKHPERNIWIALVDSEEGDRNNDLIMLNTDSGILLKKNVGNYSALHFLSDECLIIWCKFLGNPLFFDYTLNALTPDPLLASALSELYENRYVSLSFHPARFLTDHYKTKTVDYFEIKVEEKSINIVKTLTLPYTALSENRPDEVCDYYTPIKIEYMAYLSNTRIIVAGRDYNILFIRECEITETGLIPHVFSNIDSDCQMKHKTLIGKNHRSTISCMNFLSDGNLAILLQPEDRYELLYQTYKRNTGTQKWERVLEKSYNETLNSNIKGINVINNQIGNFKCVFHYVPLPFIIVPLYNQFAGIPISQTCMNIAIYNLETDKFVLNSERSVFAISVLPRSRHRQRSDGFFYPTSSREVFSFSSIKTPREIEKMQLCYRQEMEKVPELKPFPTELLALTSTYLAFFKPVVEDKSALSFFKPPSQAFLDRMAPPRAFREEGVGSSEKKPADEELPKTKTCFSCSIL